MKINRPTEGQVVVSFKDIYIGSHFEYDGRLYIKRTASTRSSNAVLLQECGCELEYIPPETQCTLVDVEISYAYRRPEKDERND